MVEFTTKKHDWGQEASKSQKKMTRLTDNRNVTVFITVINF